MSNLSVNNIYKSFGDKKVLNGVSIEVNDGEIVSLLGVSGGGKTTLFNVISGIYTPDSGTVLLDGEDVTSKPGKVSYMLQKDLLFEYKKVIDNVSLPLVLKGKSKKEARSEADKYFKTFGLDGTQNSYPSGLSGGMKQRAALLRTYLSSNGVALLDEPFSALDTITRSKMHEWYLGVMNDINLTTLFITHDIDEAILLSDRIYILSEGEIIDEITVNAEKPRSNDFALSEEFLEYKRKIIQLL